MSVVADLTAERMTCDECRSTAWVSVAWTWAASGGEVWWIAEWTCPTCRHEHETTFDEEDVP